MKFKLWDQSIRQYISTRHAAIDSDGFLFDVSNDDPIVADVLYSTGVQDRDGSELYVGDVVEILKGDRNFLRGDTAVIIFNEKLRSFGLVGVSGRWTDLYIDIFHSVGEKVKAVTREAASNDGQVTRSKGNNFRKVGDISTDPIAQILFCGEK